MFIYLDDIVIYADSLDEHDRKFRELANRLSLANLQLEPTKCQFLGKEIKYLGHIISEEGVRTDPQKTSAVANFKTPKTIKQIQSFLGLAGYYRRFIKDFAKITLPITKLLKKENTFIWGETQQKSFDTLKATLTNAPILQYPDFSKMFIVTTDASDLALGAILSQGEVGKDLPVAYASRTLRDAETRYSTSEKEMLALLFAVETFRPYLYGKLFKVITDHLPLKGHKKMRNLTLRLHRFRNRLEGYEYEIEYKPGARNVNADALSRHPPPLEYQLEIPEEGLQELEDNNTSHVHVIQTPAQTDDTKPKRRKKKKRAELWTKRKGGKTKKANFVTEPNSEPTSKPPTPQTPAKAETISNSNKSKNKKTKVTRKMQNPNVEIDHMNYEEIEGLEAIENPIPMLAQDNALKPDNDSKRITRSAAANNRDKNILDPILSSAQEDMELDIYRDELLEALPEINLLETDELIDWEILDGPNVESTIHKSIPYDLELDEILNGIVAAESPTVLTEKNFPDIYPPEDINNNKVVTETNKVKGINYSVQTECTEPNIEFKKTPVLGNGDCFYSAAGILLGRDFNVSAMKAKLLMGDLSVCIDPEEARYLLTTNAAYANENVLKLFSHEYRKNLCIHVQAETLSDFYIIKEQDEYEWLHFHLYDQHFSPLSKIILEDIGVTISPHEINKKSIPKIREKVQPRVEKINGHFFLEKGHVLFFTTSDGCWDTEVPEGLRERRILNKTNVPPKETGSMVVIKKKQGYIIALLAKQEKDDPFTSKDIKLAVATLQSVLLKIKIKEIMVSYDLELYNRDRWDQIINLLQTGLTGINIKIMVYDNCPNIPKTSKRFDIIKLHHNTTIGGHKSMEKTFNKIAASYYWKGMRQDVETFVRYCPTCQLWKVSRRKTRLPMLITTTPRNTMDLVAIDIYGKLPTTPRGHNYLLTIQDQLSKYSMAIPLNKISGEIVAKALVDNFICFFGFPKALLTDQGSYFVSSMFEEWCKIFKIKHIRTSVYHAQSNGSLERSHHVLTSYLKMFIQKDKKNWDLYVNQAMFSYNTSIHNSTNFSPFELMFGREVVFPFKEISQGEFTDYDSFSTEQAHIFSRLKTLTTYNLQMSKLKNKKYYDRKLNISTFIPGEKVYWVNGMKARKFDPDYRGPFEVISVDPKKHNVVIMVKNKEKIVHYDQLKHGFELIDENEGTLPAIMGEEEINEAII